MVKKAAALIAVLLFSLIFLPAEGTIQTLSVNTDSGTARKVEFTPLWNFELDTSFVTSPVFAHGFIYVTSTSSGSSRANLYCLNASSGTQIWNHTGYFVYFQVAKDYVYVNEIPESNFLTNFKGIVACLNAYTGAQIWNYTYGSSVSAPIIVGDYVYVSGYTPNLPTPDHGFVYALNAFTGDVIWNQTINSVVHYATVSDGRVFVNFFNEKYSDGLFYAQGLCAFDALTGKRLWNYPTGDSLNKVPNAPPIIFDNKVYVSYNNYSKTDPDYRAGGVYALDALNGTSLWNYKTSSSVATPLVTKGICYLVSNDSFLTALDASNGTVIWNHATETSLGSAQFVNGSLFVGSSTGAYRFDPSNGKVIWNFAASDYADSSATYPVYADGVIYVGWNGPQYFSSVTQHEFYALDALTGEKIGNYTLGYTVKNPPLVLSNTIYIGASWVTEESVDFSGPGVVIALNSTVTLSSQPSPQPSPPSSGLAITLTAVVVIVIIAGLLIYFKKRKH
jgi:outer membrane protein assembly factor BamB